MRKCDEVEQHEVEQNWPYSLGGRCGTLSPLSLSVTLDNHGAL